VRSVLGKGKKNPLPQRVPGPRLPLGVIIAAMTLGLIALAALFPWLLTGENPLETDSSATLQPPSADHFFLGPTSPVGMFFARVVYGARYSLAVGLGATACALLVGILLGVGAARGPRILDTALSRFIDVVMAFPEFLLALIVIAVIGVGGASIPVAVALAAIPAYARVARAETLVVSQAGYITAARALGVPPGATLFSPHHPEHPRPPYS